MTSSSRTALKGAVFVVSAVVAPFAVFLADGLTNNETITMVVLAVGAAVTFFKSNTPTNPAARAVVAIFTAVAAAVTAAWTDQMFTPEEWGAVALAFLGALQVWLSGNDDAVLHPEGGVVR